MTNSPNALCEICEKEFPREDIQLVTLGEDLPPNFRRRFNSCVECQVREQLSYYRERYHTVKGSLEELREENNLFRTLMLKPETMEVVASDPSKPPTRLHIAQHKIGWEQLSLDTILYFMEVFEAHTNAFAALANVKASAVEIKERVKAKAREQNDAALATRNAPKVTAEPKKHLTPFEKAVKAQMGLGLSKEVAESIVKQMTGMEI